MRDVEILLRGFAMLERGDKYKPSMTRFLNQFSKDMRVLETTKLEAIERLSDAFLVHRSGNLDLLFWPRTARPGAEWRRGQGWGPRRLCRRGGAARPVGSG